MTEVAPLLDRSRGAVLRAATQVLVAAPHATLGEVAKALGIGRTTLHRLFPTRHDLLLAIAHDCLDHLELVYATAGVTDPPPVGGAALAAVSSLVEGLLPWGPSLQFLLRAVELDDDAAIRRRTTELDAPLHATVEAARDHGDLDRSVPTWWAVESLLADVYIAWEQIEGGRLARSDAPALVRRTWLRGLG